MTTWQICYLHGGFRCCHRTMKPVNWSLDGKGSLIIASLVIQFFPAITRKRAGKITAFLGRLLLTFPKKKLLFFSVGKIFCACYLEKKLASKVKTYREKNK